jgi:hypothetical protein
MKNTITLGFARTRALRVVVSIGLIASLAALTFAQNVGTRIKESKAEEIDADQWGTITAPVSGTHEGGAYSAAELFAGPDKFGSYYSGVLPNGRIAKPAGLSIQIGMNPLGAVLTPDGKFLITTNDDEREGGLASYQSPINRGGYTLSVVDTATMTVVSQISSSARFFVGMVATGSGPYTVWVSGGPDNDVKLFNISSTGAISAGTPARIPIAPVLPNNQGFVSNYSSRFRSEP